MTSDIAKTWIIVPAAGRGERFSNRSDKLTVHLGHLPILVRTVETLLAAKHVDGVIVVVPPEKKELYTKLVRSYGQKKPVHFSEGGADRRESVYLGLKALPPEAEIVGIHDAARPLVDPKAVDAALERLATCREIAGVVLAVPIRDTVKRSNAEGHGVETVDRSSLWRAQTPQIFRRETILKAHEAIPTSHAVTDDAQLLELAGLGPVALLESSERNLKITTPEDLTIAEALLKK